MKADKFFDAMGEIDEKYIEIKLRIPRLPINKRVVVSSLVSFTVFYMVSYALFLVLLPDIASYPQLEGQIRQLAILLLNALGGGCSAFVLRRVLKRREYGAFVVCSAVLFLAVLAIGWVLFSALFRLSSYHELSGIQRLLQMIVVGFPQIESSVLDSVVRTAFAVPAPIAQCITLFVLVRMWQKK